MGQRLLPQTLIDLYAHALAIERDAFKRFVELERFMRDAGMDYLADEFERIGKEEQEQYEALALGTAERDLPQLESWEYAWHYFYVDVAEHANDDAVCAFAAEMAADEQRHIARLEQLLAREPENVKISDEDAEVLLNK
jgi:rubrerythrin